MMQVMKYDDAKVNDIFGDAQLDQYTISTNPTLSQDKITMIDLRKETHDIRIYNKKKLQ